MLIDLHPDTIDDMTRQSLKQLLADFKADLKQERPMIFVTEPTQDKKLIRKHIKALELIIEYFGK